MSDDFNPQPSTGPGGGYAIGGAPPPPPPPYPVSFEFNGPEQLSRLSTFFRLVLALPLLLFMAVLGGVSGGVTSGLIVAYWLSALVRKGRPVGWIGSAIVAIMRFNFRAYTYLLLLSDKYPAFEGEWMAVLEADRPERISRRQIFFWKTLAVIPHVVCLLVLWFAVAFCEVVSWFAILFTGRFPQGLRNFVVGWLRWSVRVFAYWISLRDEFPPFSLSSEATAGSKGAARVSALGGLAAVVLVSVGIGAAYIQLSQAETEHVSYVSLQQGSGSASIEVNNVMIRLYAADDDYDFPGNLLEADRDSHLVFFQASIANFRATDINIEQDDFRVREEDGDRREPVFVSFDGASSPVTLDKGDSITVTLVFNLDSGDEPGELTYRPESSLKNAKFILD